MKATALVFIAFLIVVMSSQVPIKATVDGASVGETAQQCTVTELQSCLPALTSGGKPTGDCCGKLKAQEPCLCGYIKNPAYSKYVSSPNAHKVFVDCNVSYPTC
ncbi:unnamed protein product [Arabis nemorensis]|uniref:Bifunctional inhibitor/plant lipid transfer protein/seed storage helical domain-containing protein n=1 Tax=Arabis nemorensis TaxID=586526 RepID=A0A565C6D6_9BRAS|nr:unnamed protein product [Arabis nemorensis]